MKDDKALFGLTVAQAMAEENSEAARMYGGLTHNAVRNDTEAAEYTAEIMKAIGAEHCAICGGYFVPVEDECLCPNCLAYENQAWADYQDAVRQAHIVSVGLG